MADFLDDKSDVPMVFINANLDGTSGSSNVHLLILVRDVIQGVPGGKVNILGGHNISHYKQKGVYIHVSYSERFLRQSYFTVQF
jgi:hypothetical protein